MSDKGAAHGWIVGIDVGGTFTDVIGLNRVTGETRDGKVLSTKEQEVGVLQALTAIDVAVADVAEIVHGHTVGINALLSRAGATTGLLATRGHRDLLDIGRMNRDFGENFYDPTWLRPHQQRPVVERQYRVGIPERITSDGSVLLPLDEDAVRDAARSFASRGVTSVAVCFMNSYVNPMHERRAAEIVAETMPGAYVQTSALYPVTKEHERTTTVALDAYVGPAVRGYLDRLQVALAAESFAGTLWIMMMNGGVATVEGACEAPVFQLVSGPVGGVSATTHLANDCGAENLLTMDVGGTSTDVAAIVGAKTPLTDLWTLEQGLTLTMPLVDVGSVGSGAGSIIGQDALGKVSVGPRSAGSNPGPVCYGRGGTEPTLTDACAALGILQPDLFANGSLRLDVDAALEALDRTGRQWGLSDIDLAAAAYQVACEDIAAKIRSISVYRGLDIRNFALLPFGSAGPMLADKVGEILGVERVIVPSSPGQFSAMGLLRSDLRVTRAASPMLSLEPANAASIENAFKALETDIIQDLESQGVSVEELTFDRAVFAMYKGQTWDNRMPLSTASVTSDEIPPLVRDFHRFYQDSYGFSAEDIPVVMTSIEVTAVIPRARKMPSTAVGDSGDSLLRTADLTVPGSATALCVPVHKRERLRPHVIVLGPALVSEKYASTLVLPGRRAYIDDSNLLILEYQR
ncbi:MULTISPECIES: hydantoinase/oxoprolinase family protein [unclassified Pseudofrankia]|uniref:hydantoinase/oxoprolinase family protein n=1 Tax=unclassified Pseudofrankia TaxID=2994372 RepID=UPI0008DA4F03|nr:MULTISPECIES: hydantoinase/oxoprolinase family protein [unclassified Pseudofrankia]MDT3444708.1 hydantoinase/oxoprolinase family protein [Pseudofrankia sp. BMG5.37]OHV66556.1 5-oxoprolinase [Pseudofrankia sp. BMG5.36]